MGSIFRLGFVCDRIGYFGVRTPYVLVDVLDFVVVLFQSGVFEYILFCVRVVVATGVCFG